MADISQPRRYYKIETPIETCFSVIRKLILLCDLHHLRYPSPSMLFYPSLLARAASNLARQRLYAPLLLLSIVSSSCQGAQEQGAPESSQIHSVVQRSFSSAEDLGPSGPGGVDSKVDRDVHLTVVTLSGSVLLELNSSETLIGINLRNNNITPIKLRDMTEGEVYQIVLEQMAYATWREVEEFVTSGKGTEEDYMMSPDVKFGFRHVLSDLSLILSNSCGLGSSGRGSSGSTEVEIDNPNGQSAADDHGAVTLDPNGKKRLFQKLLDDHLRLGRSSEDADGLRNSTIKRSRTSHSGQSAKDSPNPVASKSAGSTTDSLDEEGSSRTTEVPGVPSSSNLLEESSGNPLDSAMTRPRATLTVVFNSNPVGGEVRSFFSSRWRTEFLWEKALIETLKPFRWEKALIETRKVLKWSKQPFDNKHIVESKWRNSTWRLDLETDLGRLIQAAQINNRVKSMPQIQTLISEPMREFLENEKSAHACIFNRDIWLAAAQGHLSAVRLLTARAGEGILTTSLTPALAKELAKNPNYVPRPKYVGKTPLHTACSVEVSRNKKNFLRSREVVRFILNSSCTDEVAMSLDGGESGNSGQDGQTHGETGNSGHGGQFSHRELRSNGPVNNVATNRCFVKNAEESRRNRYGPSELTSQEGYYPISSRIHEFAKSSSSSDIGTAIEIGSAVSKSTSTGVTYPCDTVTTSPIPQPNFYCLKWSHIVSSDLKCTKQALTCFTRQEKEEDICNGCKEQKKLFKKRGVDQTCSYYAKNSNTPSVGDTPLHLAVKARNDEMIRLLLREFGADWTVRNGDGATPHSQSCNLPCGHPMDDQTRAKDKRIDFMLRYPNGNW